MRTVVILTILAVFGAAPLLSAQSIRVIDAAAIANGVIPPTVLESAFAPYYEDARSHRIEGTVTIQDVINEYGQLKDAKILRGLGFGLDELAIASAQGWLISPATRDGVPVSVVAEIDVPFSLGSAKALKTWQGWQEVSPPKVASKVEPVYTEEARRAGLKGIVILEAVIKNDGTVGAIRVVQGLELGLTDSAIDALKQFNFSPGQQNGQNVDV